MTGVEPSARQVCHLRAKPNDGKPKERRAERVRSFGLAPRSQGGGPPRQRAGALCTMLPVVATSRLMVGAPSVSTNANKPTETIKPPRR